MRKKKGGEPSEGGEKRNIRGEIGDVTVSLGLDREKKGTSCA